MLHPGRTAGELPQRHGSVAAFGCVAQLFDAVGGLPEEQIRRDGRAQDRDNERDVSLGELQVRHQQMDEGITPIDRHREEHDDIGEQRQTQQLEDPSDQLERPCNHQQRDGHSGDRGPHRCRPGMQEPHPRTDRDKVGSDVQGVRSDQHHQQHTDEHPRPTIEATGDELPEPLAGCKCRAVTDLLHGAHQREAHQRQPQQAEAILRPCLGVGRDARGVIV